MPRPPYVAARSSSSSAGKVQMTNVARQIGVLKRPSSSKPILKSCMPSHADTSCVGSSPVSRTRTPHLLFADNKQGDRHIFGSTNVFPRAYLLFAAVGTVVLRFFLKEPHKSFTSSLVFDSFLSNNTYEVRFARNRAQGRDQNSDFLGPQPPES